MTTAPIIKQNYFLYMPVPDPKDYTYTGGFGQVMNAFFPTDGWKKKDKYLNKLNAMSHLNDVDPGLLVIYGHGNLGRGIGTHKKNYGPKSLVKLLKKQGLARGQQNLTIYLWACNTASTDINVGGKSYALRFAEALLSAGFSGVRVVGIVGFISASGRYTSLVYDGNQSVPCVPENPPFQPTDPGRHTLYQVGDGEVVGIRTPQWHWNGPEDKVYTTWEVEENQPVLNSINLKAEDGMSFSGMKKLMSKLEQETYQKIRALEAKVEFLEKENAALRGHASHDDSDNSLDDENERNYHTKRNTYWT